MRVVGAVKRVDRRFVLFAGWVLFLVYSYPGFLSTDSVAQLLQARGVDPRSDWHPPLMSLFWTVLDAIIAGPFLMLVVQGTLFLLGVDGILRRVVSARPAALIAVALLLFPPVLAPMAVVWKDSQMAGFLLAGTAALLSTSVRWRIVGCALLGFGLALRVNAPAAVFPLLIGFWQGFGWQRWRRVAAASALGVAMVVLTMGLNTATVEVKHHPWHNSVALFDIVGTIRFARPPDDVLLPQLEGTQLNVRVNLRNYARKIYAPRLHWAMSLGEHRMFEFPRTAQARDAIAAAWWTLVRTYPRAYLGHRWHVFREAIGLSGEPVFSPVYTRFTENEAQRHMVTHWVRHGTLQRCWNDGLAALGDGPLFRAYLYLALGIVLLPLAVLHRRRAPAALAVLSSGLVYEASLFIAAPSADFRYSHWMIVCVLLATVLLFIERWRRGRPISTSSGGVRAQNVGIQIS